MLRSAIMAATSRAMLRQIIYGGISKSCRVVSNSVGFFSSSSLAAGSCRLVTVAGLSSEGEDRNTCMVGGAVVEVKHVCSA